MLEEAITMIKKQIDMYFIMLISLDNSYLENRVKEDLKREIKTRKYIVNILEEQRDLLKQKNNKGGKLCT